MSTTQQPEALEADHSEQNLEMVARWYMIDKDGMATLCTDREDAEKEAKNANMAWPHTAPHRAVQLVEAASVAASAGSEPVATVFTMEALTPGGGVKYHATIHKALPAGTKLYTHPSPPEGMVGGWMPIDTAPKYTEHGVKQHILLGYAPDEIHEDGFVSQGYWMEAEEDAPDNMGHDGGWVDVHFDFFRCGRSFGAEAYRSAGTQPTHWMPLPPHPPLPLVAERGVSREAQRNRRHQGRSRPPAPAH